jgi:transcriptional regulator with XRE-family HTH domain
MALSPQQIRAAELLAKGHSQQEVGDQIGVSRRTVLRWLKQEDFKNLSYGLVGRVGEPAKPPPQRSPQPTGTLKVEDLVGDALEAVKCILQDPDARTADKLKAAALVGQWSGLENRGKMHEIECVKALIEADWISGTALDVILEGCDEFISKVQTALGTSSKQKSMYEDFYRSLENVQQKSPSPEEFSGEGLLASNRDGSPRS